MPKVLIGSPVRQNRAVLEEFLKGLLALELEGIQADFSFIDDNDTLEAKSLLATFCPPYGNVTIISGEPSNLLYRRDDITHYWREELIWRVARYKNTLISLAKEKKYDYLFLVDSDLVLHPWTLKRLIETGKDIISEVYWTRWQPGMPELPQVWLEDQYTLYNKHRGEVLSEEEKSRRTLIFLEQLRKPGIYKVGGLGGCTLISRRALEAGVSFGEIYNVSFWGEDRHFCLRAVALGFELFVDTAYPAYHIYRDDDLEGVEKYKEEAGIQTSILKTVKKAIEIYGTTDYRVSNCLEALPYLAPSLKEKLKADQSRNLEYIRQTHLISTAQVDDMVIEEFEPLFGSARVRCRVRNSGIENGHKFDDYFIANVRVQKYDSEWLIADVNFKPLHELLSPDKTPKPQEREACSPTVIRPYLEVPVVIQRQVKKRGNRITLSMLVRNEADRYLTRVLKHVRPYIDEAVILDDPSDDNTVEVCKLLLKDIPHRIVSNPEPGFHNEISLRKQQWELTVETEPAWILVLDADEIFEDRAQQELRKLVQQEEYDYFAFRLYDFWDEEHYREDLYWQAHKRYWPLLIRYRPDFPYEWRETPQHCGRIPWNIIFLPGALSDLRIKHYGWANPRDRELKYKRYMLLDPDGRYGNIGQYRSILDSNPRLIKWVE